MIKSLWRYMEPSFAICNIVSWIDFFRMTGFCFPPHTLSLMHTMHDTLTWKWWISNVTKCEKNIQSMQFVNCLKCTRRYLTSSIGNLKTERLSKHFLFSKRKSQNCTIQWSPFKYLLHFADAWEIFSASLNGSRKLPFVPGESFWTKRRWNNSISAPLFPKSIWSESADAATTASFTEDAAPVNGDDPSEGSIPIRKG